MKQFEKRTATIGGKQYESVSHLPHIKVGENIITQMLWKEVKEEVNFLIGSRWWYDGQIEGTVYHHKGWVKVISRHVSLNTCILAEADDTIPELGGTIQWFSIANLHKEEPHITEDELVVGSRWYHKGKIPFIDTYDGWVTVAGGRIDSGEGEDDSPCVYVSTDGQPKGWEDYKCKCWWVYIKNLSRSEK